MKRLLLGRLSGALFAFLIVLLVHFPLHAATANGNLAGIVLDAHGQPVAHASVTLQTSDGQLPRATYTDASGHFEFARYRRGQYDLRAAAHGSYSDWAQRVLIHAGKTTVITLRLKQ